MVVFGAHNSIPHLKSDRITNLIGGKFTKRLIMGTFHSIFCKILRKNIIYLEGKKFNANFQLKGKTMLKNYLKLFLTNNFIDFFLKESNLDGETQLSRIDKKSKNRLIENLKRFTFEITGFNENLSKVTIGGVDLDNVNPKTMESTIIPNLYFAGEVLDLHGPTGGYNLQIAFSTGYLAGFSASKK